MAFFDISVNELPESTNNFEPLPEGWYTATIQAADLTDTKAGTGQYIKVKYSIVAPTHEGRIVFGNINIRNPNPKAEEIARQQLGEIMRAIGLARITDTDQLIGNTLMIKLAIRKSEEYGDSNDIKGFKSTGAAPNIPVPAAPSQAAEPTSTKAAPPWAKK